MDKKELFGMLCDIVAQFDGAIQRLIDKNDHDLLKLFYKTDNCVLEEQQDVLFKEGYEDVLEIAVLFETDSIRDDLLPKMPSTLLERLNSGIELSEEDKEKMSPKEEEITDQNIADMKEIVFGSKDDFEHLLEEIEADEEANVALENSSRQSLMDLYLSSVGIESVPIEDLHYLVLEIGGEYGLI